MKNLAFLLFCLVSATGRAQPSPGVHQSFKTPKDIIVCYADERSANTRIPEPEAYWVWNRAGGRAQGATANFVVTYNGFSEPAKKAFQRAVDIWSTLITSNVTININAVWRNLGQGILGSCSPTTFEKNFPEAQYQDVLYPVSLANKMANRDLNGDEAEIDAQFSSSISWNYELEKSSSPRSGRYDLVSVVMHEIGHGLGIFSAYEVSGRNGRIRTHPFFQGSPCAYDLSLQNLPNSSGPLTPIIGYASPSADLKSALTEGSLFFNSPSVLRLNAVKGKAYAPIQYSAGSSIAHNDEAAYPSGNANSLMTPNIAANESIHDPGPITLGELSDMGWTNPILAHTPLPSVESTSHDFSAVCTIISGDADYTPAVSSLQLNYSMNGGSLVAVTMTPTSRANEYRGIIPKTATSQEGTVKYVYFISINDSRNRPFSWPGKICRVGTSEFTQTYYKFEAGPDTQSPQIYHTPVVSVMSSANVLKLTACFKDAYGVQGGTVDWQVNGGAQARVNFTHVSDSTYEAVLPLTDLNLARGNRIEYRLTATDNAAAHNASFKPSASEYYTINVKGYGPVQESYANNFDNLNADDFSGDFTIAKPVGFDNGAIQSPHPYAESKKEPFLNFTYELLTPIRVKAGMGDIHFDEVVLAEPAQEGISFGAEGFNDFVIVEGSSDKGITWKAVADGWNSREKADWLAAWDRGMLGSNSVTTGHPSHFHRRSLSLLDNFRPNEEVILRFRLSSDPTSVGWGWAIDNLEIQVPQLLFHNHADYMMDNAKSTELLIGVADVSKIKTLTLEYNLNGGDNQSKAIPLDTRHNGYNISLTPSGKLLKGNCINYRFKASNVDDYEFSLPSSGYYRIEILDLKNPTDTYDFNAVKDNIQFAGNFIAKTKTSAETEHPYAVGSGLRYQSNFSAILKTPIKIKAQTNFSYDEKLMLGTGDTAVVEGPKDGIRWEALADKYTVGSPKSRKGSFLRGGKFKEGDTVLLRFRLSSDKTNNGWGWRISNLKIQSTVTAIHVAEEFSLFPNPTQKGDITILTGEMKNDFAAHVTDIYGRQIMTQTFSAGSKEIKLPVDHLSAGVYLVTVIEGESRRTVRFVKR